MLFFFTFNVNKNIIEIYNNKDIKFFCQNLVDIALKNSQYVGQSKKHYLVLEMAIAGSKDRLQFNVFLDSHLIIDISLIELDKMLSLA